MFSFRGVYFVLWVKSLAGKINMVPQRLISSSPIENWTIYCYVHAGLESIVVPCMVILMYLHRFGGLTAGSDKNLPAFSSPVFSLLTFFLSAFGVVNAAVTRKVHCNSRGKTILPCLQVSTSFIALLAAGGSCWLPPFLSLTPAPEKCCKW